MACASQHPDLPVRCQAPDSHPNHDHHFAMHHAEPVEWDNLDYVPPPAPPPKREDLRDHMRALAGQVPPPERRTDPPQSGAVFHHFDGATYDPELDGVRLNAQARRVWNCIRAGRWTTLAEIASATGDPEASVSARLRDFRKQRFGGFEIDRRRRGRPEDGIFEYRLTGRRVVEGDAPLGAA